uniref:Uncharacterized protein n=1 Tax=Lepeophtheirus salmonis TaxID=72036 RepID=A0A0K2VGP3_LEPSM
MEWVSMKNIDNNGYSK